MKNDEEKKNVARYIGCFALGYFLTDFIFSLFRPRKK